MSILSQKKSVAFLLMFSFITIGSFAEESPKKVAVLELMLHYKEFFGQYILVQGYRAEMESDEFVLEAFENEYPSLKRYAQTKDWKTEELFVNIRLEDRPLIAKLQKLPEHTPVLLLVEVRESAIYNKIIPVFVAHDFSIIETPAQSTENVSSTTMTAEKVILKRNRRKIRIRRR